MGADGWDLSLFHDDVDVSSVHAPLLRADSRGFRNPDELQPWSSDSAMLGLLTWDEGSFVLYHVDSGAIFKPEIQSYAFSLRWSHTHPNLLVVFQDRVSLFGSRAEVIGSTRWQLGKQEHPFAAWWPTGEFFIAVGRTRASPKICLVVLDGEDARVVESVDLDPLDLVPYEPARYMDLSRDDYSLHLRFGAGAGSLLDHWTRITFDPGARALALYTFRPGSEPYRQGNHLVCNAEERGVLVRLAT